jgi:CHASE3 domain sensor protein
MQPTQKNKKVLFWLGMSLPMVALLAMTWLVHQAGGRFNNSFAYVMRTYKVLDMFDQTQALIVDAEANQRGYFLTGKRDYLEPYHHAMDTIHQHIGELKKLTSADPLQQSNLASLEAIVDEELEFNPDTIFADGQVTTNSSVVSVTTKGKEKLEHIQKYLFQAQEEQQQTLIKRQQEAEADVVSSQITSLVLIAAVALALIMVVVILLRLEKLQEFVTICAWTGQVKFQGQWLRLDEYLNRQFGISVSHSLSQEAADKMMKEIEELNRAQGQPPAPK